MKALHLSFLFLLYASAVPGQDGRGHPFWLHACVEIVAGTYFFAIAHQMTKYVIISDA